MSKLIDDSPELQDALRRKGSQITSVLQLLEGESEKQKFALLDIQQRGDSLDARLDFLLKDGNMTDASSFRHDYSIERAKLKVARDEIEQAIHRLSGQKHELEQNSFDWKTLGSNARKVLGVIAEHDPVALVLNIVFLATHH